MGISIGKTSLYVAGAGLHPARVLPVCLDVGTDNASLRGDPLYLGTDRPRISGPAYDGLVEAFLSAASRRWPAALIQFEDFGIDNAFRLLDRHRSWVRCFNDDIQGTGAVVRAGLLSAVRRTARRLENQKVFIVGAGSAGIGIARMLSDADVWCFDSRGLLTTGRDVLRPFQRGHARRDPPGTLLETARRVRPTVLIGVTGKAGIFTRELIEAVEGPEPIVFALSNPSSNCEAAPDKIREWSHGRAVVATGSPFPGTAQCNNLHVFPGLGLGVLASRATAVADPLFHAAAEALSERTEPGELFPPLKDIRKVSLEIAFAVGTRAAAAGAAPPCDPDSLRTRIRNLTWEPRYLPYRRSVSA